MTIHLFEHASVFDGVNEELLEDHHVLVEDNRIREVSDRPITGVEADIIDSCQRQIRQCFSEYEHIFPGGQVPECLVVDVCERNLQEKI